MVLVMKIVMSKLGNDDWGLLFSLTPNLHFPNVIRHGFCIALAALFARAHAGHKVLSMFLRASGPAHGCPRAGDLMPRSVLDASVAQDN